MKTAAKDSSFSMNLGRIKLFKKKKRSFCIRFSPNLGVLLSPQYIRQIKTVFVLNFEKKHIPT